MNTPQTENTQTSKWSFILNLVFGILALLGTAACLVFYDHDSVSRGTMGLFMGAVGSLFAASLSYADYQRQKRVRAA
jgi:hypothetical protein